MLRLLASRAFALAVLVFGFAGCADPAPATQISGCSLERRAVVPLRSARNFMLATLSLNGHDMTMVVDTGAEATTLTPRAVALLGLPADGHGSLLRGVTGNVRSANATLHQLAIDGMIVGSDLSVGVSEMPAFPGVHPAVAGLLGTDVLAHYEVELDVPDRRMALYSQHGCDGYIPWPRATAIPFQRTASGLAFVGAQVDGRQVRAMLDTGARTTLMTRATAMSLGVSAATLAGASARSGIGIGMGSIAFRQLRFAEIGLPGDLERDMPVNIAELDLPGIDMLLGADYVDARHAWISYGTGRLFMR
jgi:predicted aspartyl protease